MMPELQPFFRKHVFWQTRLPFCKRFAKYKLACGVLRHKVQNTFGTDVVSLSGYAHGTAALYASRGIASRHDCLGPRLPLFFPDSHYTFAILDVTDPGFRRCAIPSGDAAWETEGPTDVGAVDMFFVADGLDVSPDLYQTCNPCFVSLDPSRCTSILVWKWFGQQIAHFSLSSFFPVFFAAFAFFVLFAVAFSFAFSFLPFLLFSFSFAFLVIDLSTFIASGSLARAVCPAA